MFDPKQLLKGGINAAPTYLLNNLPNILLGAASCYTAVLFMFGPLSFFNTLWNLATLALINYLLSGTVEFVLNKRIFRTPAAAVAAAPGSSAGAKPAGASSSGASAKAIAPSSPKQGSTSGRELD